MSIIIRISLLIKFNRIIKRFMLIYLSIRFLQINAEDTILAANLAISNRLEKFRGGHTMPGLELIGNAAWLFKYMSSSHQLYAYDDKKTTVYKYIVYNFEMHKMRKHLCEE